MNANLFKPLLLLSNIKLGKRVTLKGIPVIFCKSGASLEIGNDVVIKSSFWSNLVGLYSRTIIMTRLPKARISIGDNVGISGATIYARKEIVIGDGTLIGGNTKIIDNDFHPLEVEARLANDTSKIRARAIHIGKNCFVGCNALILKGTEIGDGCIVGAGAVVSGKFEAGCVIAGNPARVIKRLE